MVRTEWGLLASRVDSSAGTVPADDDVTVREHRRHIREQRRSLVVRLAALLQESSAYS